jgi:hypothetical protein
MWPWATKKDDYKLSELDKFVVDFCEKIREPVLNFVGNNPVTVYSIGFDSHPYGRGLALSIENPDKSRVANFGMSSDLAGFKREFSEDRINLFVGNLYDGEFYEKLKTHLEDLQYRVPYASYITVFPEPKIHGFGPICLTKKEREIHDFLKKKYGKSDQKPQIKAWVSLPLEFKSLLDIGDEIVSYAKNGFDDELTKLFKDFAKRAYVINNDRKNPEYNSPERNAFGNYTSQLYGAALKLGYKEEQNAQEKPKEEQTEDPQGALWPK